MMIPVSDIQPGQYFILDTRIFMRVHKPGPRTVLALCVGCIEDDDCPDRGHLDSFSSGEKVTPSSTTLTITSKHEIKNP